MLAPKVASFGFVESKKFFWHPKFFCRIFMDSTYLFGKKKNFYVGFVANFGTRLFFWLQKKFFSEFSGFLLGEKKKGGNKKGEKKSQQRDLNLCLFSTRKLWLFVASLPASFLFLWHPFFFVASFGGIFFTVFPASDGNG